MPDDQILPAEAGLMASTALPSVQPACGIHDWLQREGRDSPDIAATTSPKRTARSRAQLVHRTFRSESIAPTAPATRPAPPCSKSTAADS